MTKSIGSLLFLSFLLILSFNTGGAHSRFANIHVTPSERIGEKNKSWCVARPSASEEELRSNIEFACIVLSSCSVIQPGGSCADPPTLINQASVVMNLYYSLKGRNPWDCDFKNSALIVLTDPSYNSCNYA